MPDADTTRKPLWPVPREKNSNGQRYRCTAVTNAHRAQQRDDLVTRQSRPLGLRSDLALELRDLPIARMGVGFRSRVFAVRAAKSPRVQGAKRENPQSYVSIQRAYPFVRRRHNELESQCRLSAVCRTRRADSNAHRLRDTGGAHDRRAVRRNAVRGL